MYRIRVIHGPNLNLLGQRETRFYGSTTLEEIDRDLVELGQEFGAEVLCSQSNSEGEIVEWIQQSAPFDALILNPAAYTHTSLAIRDALLSIDIPAFEVHLSNVYQREPFRQHSFVADVVVGRIVGFGAQGYSLALRGAMEYLMGVEEPTESKGES